MRADDTLGARSRSLSFMRRFEIGTRVVEAIGWAVVAVMGVVMISQAVGLEANRLIVIAQSLTPFGILPLVLVAALATWRRRRSLAIGAAAVGLAAVLLALPIITNSGKTTARADALGLRATSVNLLFDNPQVDRVADELLAIDPDLIVFSEFTESHRDTLLNHALADGYSYKISRAAPDAGGMAMWSKYPVDDRSAEEYRAIEAVLDAPDGEIVVVGVHPPTPVYDHDLWRADLARLEEKAQTTTEPLLMLGDFNSTYWHPPFRDLLDAGLTSAHIAHGRGWSTSWPADVVIPPFARLDHALTGNGLVATSIDDFDVTGSDHVGFVVNVAPRSS
jgi:MYXO-CTERM domain-containing protein